MSPSGSSGAPDVRAAEPLPLRRGRKRSAEEVGLCFAPPPRRAPRLREDLLGQAAQLARAGEAESSSRDSADSGASSSDALRQHQAELQADAHPQPREEPSASEPPGHLEEGRRRRREQLIQMQTQILQLRREELARRESWLEQHERTLRDQLQRLQLERDQLQLLMRTIATSSSQQMFLRLLRALRTDQVRGSNVDSNGTSPHDASSGAALPGQSAEAASRSTDQDDVMREIRRSISARLSLPTLPPAAAADSLAATEQPSSSSGFVPVSESETSRVTSSLTEDQDSTSRIALLRRRVVRLQQAASVLATQPEVHAAPTVAANNSSEPPTAAASSDSSSTEVATGGEDAVEQSPQGSNSSAARIRALRLLAEISVLSEMVTAGRSRQGLSPEVIEERTTREVLQEVPQSTDASGGLMQTQCVVCLEDFKVQDELRVLPCRHRYHSGCIDNWLARSRHCPVCKRDVTAQQ
eukprot:TRINITY_DN33239_c0_g1_i1.p1 TRINITY_DN33239_c0_g1~~TRINITY_DN33239_c0_g1_i1.p1  ORF type:complete len:481 (+),score=107.19 TRINITY_DN33239_c0_g1_i1:35-1444(+)